VAAKQWLPTRGTVLLSVAEKDRDGVVQVAQAFSQLGFAIRATRGTHAFLKEHGIASEMILKMHEGRPNVADSIKNGEIHLVINTPIGRLGQTDDSYIRKAAIKHRLPYITTLAAAVAAAKAIEAITAGDPPVRSLQEYHAEIR